MQLFVYGTLKTDERNNIAYLTGQHYLGPARTMPHYRLFDIGPYPGLVERTDGLAIHGELWEVDVPALAEIDRLEEVDAGLYERKMIQLAEPDTEALVYLYLRDVSGCADCGSSWSARAVID